MLFHNAVHSSQSNPHSTSSLFGCKKRFEDVVQSRRVHAHASVGYRKQNISSRNRMRVRRRKFLVNLNGLGLNEQTSTLRHGVSRIQTNVDQNLSDLSWVAENVVWSGSERHLHFNRPSYHTVEETGCF